MHSNCPAVSVRLRAFAFFAAIVVFAVLASVCCASRQMTVSIIDVGQGDSMLVSFPNGQHMLVDAGEFGDGKKVVKYLASHGVKRIDILVATHPHSDHIGGMSDVLARFKIGKVWDSGYSHGSQAQLNFYATIKAKGIRFGKPTAGFSQTVDDAKITVLVPPKRKSVNSESDANNSSIVLLIAYRNTSFLLTGDMESEERCCVSRWSKVTVLKVAHHGSSNGTDAAFLKSTRPQYAVISVGANNRYGHPDTETLSCLKRAKIKTYMTSRNGDVVFTSDGKTIKVTTSVRPVAKSKSLRASKP